MKTRHNHPYSDIASFEDFQLEKERLLMKRKLIETRLKLSYVRISNTFSITNTIFSTAKEFFLPKISNLLGWLLNKVEDKTKS